MPDSLLLRGAVLVRILGKLATGEQEPGEGSQERITEPLSPDLEAALKEPAYHPEREIWTIVGDGGFQMTQAELSTAVNEGANVKIAIMNNNFLGMVRQWQEFFFERRYSAVEMRTPDFIKIAEAHGIPARRVDQPDQVAAGIEFARQTSGPALVEFMVEKEEAVYPMVPAGADLDEMIRRPLVYLINKNQPLDIEPTMSGINMSGLGGR